MSETPPEIPVEEFFQLGARNARMGQIREERTPVETPMPTYTLTQVLGAAQEAAGGDPTKAEPLVDLIATLLDIPPYDAGPREAILAQLLG